MSNAHYINSHLIVVVAMKNAGIMNEHKPF